MAGALLYLISIYSHAMQVILRITERLEGLPRLEEGVETTPKIDFEKIVYQMLDLPIGLLITIVGWFTGYTSDAIISS